MKIKDSDSNEKKIRISASTMNFGGDQ